MFANKNHWDLKDPIEILFSTLIFTTANYLIIEQTV